VIIILEGPDLAGKTTLAGRLTEAWGPERTMVLNYGPPQIQNPFLEYEVEFLERLPADPEVLVICDRLAMGELVYGPLLRARSRLTRGGLLHCEMLYSALGAVKVMLMPPLAVLHARYRERGDDLIDEAELTAIRETYATLAPRFRYEQLRDAGSADTEDLLHWAQARGALARELSQGAPGYAGHQAPLVVFAGDVRAGKPEYDPYRYAFTPAAYGAAQFLMDSLAPYSRVVLAQAGIMNTLEEGLDLQQAHKVLGHPAWVALGRFARERLSAAGISHTQVHHPSYVRRFRKRTEAEYGKDLMQAAGLHAAREAS
jgi:hypothetical protein